MPEEIGTPTFGLRNRALAWRHVPHCDNLVIFHSRDIMLQFPGTLRQILNGCPLGEAMA